MQTNLLPVTYDMNFVFKGCEFRLLLRCSWGLFKDPIIVSHGVQFAD